MALLVADVVLLAAKERLDIESTAVAAPEAAGAVAASQAAQAAAAPEAADAVAAPEAADASAAPEAAEVAGPRWPNSKKACCHAKIHATKSAKP